MSSSNWVFASSNQKTVFWWRHIVLKLCLLYSTGVQTPYMLKYKCGMYNVFMKSEFWPRPIRKKVFWWRHTVFKMRSLKSTGAKTPYMFKYKCYMYYVFIFSLKLVSSNQKTVFCWRHTVLKICPSYSTGPQTPWLLATLTFLSVLNEYLFLAHFEFILAHSAAFSRSVVKSNPRVWIWKYRYFKWGARLHLDKFGVFIFLYTILQAFRTWKDIFVKFNVNLWKIGWKI